MNIFEQASRTNLTFRTPSGTLGVNDLWTLPVKATARPVTSLESIALNLQEQIEKYGKISFLEKSKVPETLQLQFDIVKFIYEDKQAQKVSAQAAKETATFNAKIDELIAQKQDQALGNLTLEQLLAMKK